MMLKLLSLTLLSSPAQAQDRIDATVGVWLAPSDTTAMGGAGIATASGSSGLFFQPAAPAVRHTGQLEWYHPTGNLSWMNIGAGDPVDLGNTGLDAATWGGTLINVGAASTLGNMGLGAAARNLTYRGDEQSVAITEAHMTLARRMLDGRLVVGGGLRALRLDASLTSATALWVGTGVETGAILASGDSGWSAGVSWRSQAIAQSPGGAVLGVNEVVTPAQLGVGGAWDSRYATDWPRHLHLVADVVVNGVVEDGIAIEPLARDEILPKGEAVTWTPKVGGELEIWPDRVKLRAGSYVEASRTAAAASRLHGTFGWEVRLVHLEGFWGLLDHDVSWSVSVDRAERYTNAGFLGLGFWNPSTLLVEPVDWSDPWRINQPR